MTLIKNPTKILLKKPAHKSIEKPAKKPVRNAKKAYSYTVYLLAKREYSKLELIQKLTLKEYQPDDIDGVIAKLIEQDYQNDERFAKSFVKMRVNQGKGKLLISQQLKQKGINEFDFSKFNFNTLAKELRLRKYGETEPKNYTEKAKQMRFLQGRGFSFDEINATFK